MRLEPLVTGITKRGKAGRGPRATARSWVWVEYLWDGTQTNRDKKRVLKGLAMLGAEEVDTLTVEPSKTTRGGLLVQYKLDARGQRFDAIQRILGSFGIRSGVYYGQRAKGGMLLSNGRVMSAEQRRGKDGLPIAHDAKLGYSPGKEREQAYKANCPALNAQLYRIGQELRATGKMALAAQQRWGAAGEALDTATVQAAVDDSRINTAGANYTAAWLVQRLQHVRAVKGRIILAWQEERIADDKAERVQTIVDRLTAEATSLVAQLSGQQTVVPVPTRTATVSKPADCGSEDCDAHCLAYAMFVLRGNDLPPWKLDDASPAAGFPLHYRSEE